MEGLEHRALQTFVRPPTLWKRYVDDTIAKLKINDVDGFLSHLNSLHPRIKFTTELMHTQSIAFLDTHLMVQPNNTVNVKVYRKPTHTDQYLSFTSNHHIKQKLGIISTFRHRIDKLITTEKDKRLEEIHMRKALKKCDYPEWTFKKPRKRKTRKNDDENMPVVSLPYIKNISEKVARTLKKFGIKAIHKPSTTIKNILVKTKDPVHKLDKAGALYHIKFKPDKEDYCGETERAMKVRGYEHKIISHKDMKRSHSIAENNSTQSEEDSNTRKSSRLANKGRKDYKKMNEGEKYIENAGNSEVAKHMMEKVYTKEDTELEITGYERNWRKRGIKEAINIKRLGPSLNLDKGRHHLSAIWNDLIGGKASSRTASSKVCQSNTH